MEASDAFLDGTHDLDLPSPKLSENSPLSEWKDLQIYSDLQSKCRILEESLLALQRERDETRDRNLELVDALKEISVERDALRLELDNVKSRVETLTGEKDDEIKEKTWIWNELQAAEVTISEMWNEKKRGEWVLSEGCECVQSVGDCLKRIIEKVAEGRPGEGVVEGDLKPDLVCEEEYERFLSDVKIVHRLARKAELQVFEYESKRTKEKKELERSVVSLTEENRDMSSLLRVALVEKEALERNLNKLKGSSEQKRVPLLQFAEKGLQKVGFGFIMGSSAGGFLDGSNPKEGPRSDGVECEEEVVSLASSFEKIVKNLRLEITQLRQSLEDSRSDGERLQILAEEQAHDIEQKTLYIKDLEEREALLTQKVEELIKELKESEADVFRWREACELEVEAGKISVQVCDNEIATLKEELNRVEASMDLLVKKVMLKEELASAAAAAQEAAERSLQLVDSRCAGFHARMEELTRQLEEAETRGERAGRRRVRYVCWPWRALRIIPTTRRGQHVVRRLPDMEALLY